MVLPNSRELIVYCNLGLTNPQASRWGMDYELSLLSFVSWKDWWTENKGIFQDYVMNQRRLWGNLLLLDKKSEDINSFSQTISDHERDLGQLTSVSGLSFPIHEGLCWMTFKNHSALMVCRCRKQGSELFHAQNMIVWSQKMIAMQKK